MQTAQPGQAAAGEQEQAAADGSSPSAGAGTPGPAPAVTTTDPVLSPANKDVTGITVSELRKGSESQQS